MSTITDELLTVKEVAKAFKVSPVTVARWEKNGALKALRLTDRTLRFRRSDVAALIEQAEVRARLSILSPERDKERRGTLE